MKKVSQKTKNKQSNCFGLVPHLLNFVAKFLTPNYQDVALDKTDKTQRFC